MPRKTQPGRLTPVELELMNVLWKNGQSTVQMVVDRLPRGRDLAYTSVQTILNILHRKRKVKRVLKNRAYFYEPAISHSRAAGQALKDIVQNLFEGSPERLVLNMIETHQLTAEKLRELESLILEAEKKPRGKPS